MKQSMGLTPDATSPLTRSATVANPIPPPSTFFPNGVPDDVELTNNAEAIDDDFRANALQRAKTTINVSVASRAGPASAPADRPANAFVPTPRSSTPPNNMPSSAAPLGRANTTAGRAGPGAGMGPTRGLSIRKPGIQSPGPVSAPAQPGVRTTEIYDSYLDGYADEPLPPVPEGRQTPRRAGTMGGRGRAQAPSSMYSSASSAGGMGVRRRPTRRPTMQKRQVSTYEEEEGYESGEWDEGPMELVKIRVKVRLCFVCGLSGGLLMRCGQLHYKDDVRGMAFGPEMPWEEFLERVTSKFNRALDGLGMKFKDEDGGKVRNFVPSISLRSLLTHVGRR